MISSVLRKGLSPARVAVLRLQCKCCSVESCPKAETLRVKRHEFAKSGTRLRR